MCGNVLPKNFRGLQWKKITEARHGLDGWERDSPAIVLWAQPENTFALTIGQHFLESDNIRVHGPNIISIPKDKSPLLVKPASNDVFSVFNAQVRIVLDIFLILIEEKFLVIGQLNYQRTFKSLLQPLREYKG
jgi:hypothetical protein